MSFLVRRRTLQCVCNCHPSTSTVPATTSRLPQSAPKEWRRGIKKVGGGKIAVAGQDSSAADLGEGEPGGSKVGVEGAGKEAAASSISAAPAGVVLKGLGYLKGAPDPIAREDSEYPPWLFQLLSSPTGLSPLPTSLSTASTPPSANPSSRTSTTSSGVDGEGDQGSGSGPSEGEIIEMELKRRKREESIARKKEIKANNFLRAKK